METNKAEISQKKFLNKIKDTIPQNLSLVDELADLLEISNDSAYRRLRGETLLTIDEIEKICIHFKVSFDPFELQKTESVTFNYRNLKSIDDFKHYLSSIRNDLVKIKSVPEKHIFYAAIDIPVFYNFKFKELGLFKIFYWLKAIVNDPALEGKKFVVNEEFEELYIIGEEIYDLYTDIPSTEVWNEGTILGLLKQIEYCWDSGYIENKEDAHTICNQFLELLSIVKNQAEFNTKTFIKGEAIPENENYTLYRSETEIGNNCIMVTLGEFKTVYLTHNTLNKIITVNPEFCAETSRWLDNLLKKSVLISGVSEKQRFQFFNFAQSRVQELIEKIEGN